MKSLSEKYTTNKFWCEDLTPPQLKSKAQQRITEIEAGLKQLCSDLAEYFENTKTYEEIRTGVENDLEADDYKNLQGFFSSYDREGKQDGQDYSTVLGTLKKTSLSVMALDHAIENHTDKVLLKLIPTVEQHFKEAMLCLEIPKAMMQPLTGKVAARQEARRQGGKKRAENYHEIKDKVAQLLHDQRPPTGWKNKADAARQLADQIAEYQQKYPERNRLSDENITGRICRWLYEDKTLDAFFKQTKSN